LFGTLQLIEKIMVGGARPCCDVVNPFFGGLFVLGMSFGGHYSLGNISLARLVFHNQSPDG
jgi:hypothetical protein